MTQLLSERSTNEMKEVLPVKRLIGLLPVLALSLGGRFCIAYPVSAEGSGRK